MPHDIFISYSRRDLAAVKPIKEELENLGFSCWMDLEGIESGSAEFTRSITNAINESKVLLFFLSEHSQASEWSMNELRFAKTKAKRVVLVRINNDALTDSFSFTFGGYDIVDWRIGEQKGKLLRDLTKWLRPLSDPPPTSHIPSQPSMSMPMASPPDDGNAEVPPIEIVLAKIFPPNCSRNARTAGVLGIVSLFSVFFRLFALAGPFAAFFAIKALRELERDSGKSGKGWALFGFIVGIFASLVAYISCFI